MSLYLDIRRVAMAAALEPDEEAQLRAIFRWYSKEFHTPLWQVADLPLDFVLQAYWEDRYLRMVEREGEDPRHEEALREELRLLLETDEQRAERLMQEDQQQDDDEAFAREFEKEEATAAVARQKKAHVVKQQIEQNIMGLSKKSKDHPGLGGLLENLKEVSHGIKQVARGLREEPSLPDPGEPLPPEVKISFVDPDEFEKDLDGYGTMSDPRGKE